MSIKFNRALHSVRKMQPDEIGQGYIDLAANRLSRSRDIMWGNWGGPSMSSKRATGPAREAARVLREASANGALPARSASDAEGAAQLIDQADGVIAKLAMRRLGHSTLSRTQLHDDMRDLERLIRSLEPADDASIAALTAQRQLGRGAANASTSAAQTGQKQLTQGSSDEIVDAVVVEDGMAKGSAAA